MSSWFVPSFVRDSLAVSDKFVRVQKKQIVVVSDVVNCEDCSHKLRLDFMHKFHDMTSRDSLALSKASFLDKCEMGAKIVEEREKFLDGLYYPEYKGLFISCEKLKEFVNTPNVSHRD